MLELTDHYNTGYLSTEEATAAAKVTERTIRRLSNGEASWLLREYLTLVATGRIVPAKWRLKIKNNQVITNTGFILTLGQLEQYGWHLTAFQNQYNQLNQAKIEITELRDTLTAFTHQHDHKEEIAA